MLDGQILAFLVAITVLTIAPGADTVMVTRNSIRGGFRDGAITSFGICSGLFVHAMISAGGVSLILLGSATLFQAVKLVGAAYLIWLGVQSLHSAWRGNTSGRAADTVAVTEAFSGMVLIRRSLREGFLSNMLNPKIAIFYMAFLPQFMNPEENMVMQAILLAGIHFGLTLLWQCSLAAMIDKARKFLSSPRVSAWLDGIAGTMLLAFGLRLALDD